MKKHLITLLLFCFSLSHAQRYEKNYGGPGQDEARDLVELSDGSIVMIGTSRSYGAGGKDMFVVKVNASGTVQWTLTLGSTGDEEGLAVTRGNNNEIYVAGLVPQSGSNLTDIQVYRFNANGVQLGSMFFGSSQNDRVNDMAFKGNRLYLVGSTFGNGAQQEDIWFLKTDQALTTTINKNIGFALNESANRICFTSDGNLLLAGRTSSFGGNTSLVVKANLQGDTLWTKTFDLDNRNGYNSQVKGIAELSNQQLLITGPGSPSSSGYTQMFHQKLSSNGSVLYTRWSGQLSDEGADVVAGTNGAYYVLSGYCNFGCALRLFKYDNAGNELLNIPYQHGGGNAFPNFALPASLFPGASKRILISGTTYTTDSDGDMYLARLDSAGAVSVALNPVITAAGSLSICSGDSVALSVPGGYSAYQWFYTGSAGTNHVGNGSVLQARSTGTYRCFITTSDGIYRSNLVNVTVTALPNVTVTASGSLSFCSAAGQSLSLSVPTATPAPTYQWRLNGTAIAGATSNTFSPVQSGEYTVQVSNACTSLTSAAQSVNATRVPAPDLVCSDVYCMADPYPCGIVPNGALQVENYGIGTTYNWFKDGVSFGNTTNSVASWGLLPGIYTCEVSNACGTGTSQPYEVVGGTAITSNLKLNACNTQSAGVLYAPVNSSPPYQWFFNGAPVGNGSSSLAVTQSGSYRLDYFASPCNTIESSPAVGVNLNSPAGVTISASGPLSVCTGTITLNATTGGIVNATYNWYRGSTLLQSGTSSSFVATQTGEYSCKRWQPSCGFSTSNTIAISVGPPLAGQISTLNGNSAICSLVPGQLRIRPAYPSLYNYQWYRNGTIINGATGATYTPVQSGSYTCLATNTCGNMMSNAFPVSYFTLPVPSFTWQGDTIGCPGDPVVLQGVPGTGLSYQWLRNNSVISGATSPSFVVNSSGAYTLRITVPGGCAATSNPPVNINVIGTPSLSITTQSYPMGCTGDLLYMNTAGTNVSSYQWFRNGVPLAGQTAPSFVTSQGGTYTVSGSNACTSVLSLPLNYVVRSKPAATINPSGPLSFCNGDSVVLNANTGTGLSYSWMRNGGQLSGAFSSSLTVKQPGFYRLTVVNSFGCGKQSLPLQVVVPCREGKAETELSAWPNPTSGSFYLSMTGFDERSEIEIFDLAGRRVEGILMQSPDGTTLVSGLLPGLYLITVRDSRDMASLKVIVTD
jgi:hypothetical protein